MSYNNYNQQQPNPNQNNAFYSNQLNRQQNNPPQNIPQQQQQQQPGNYMVGGQGRGIPIQQSNQSQYAPQGSVNRLPVNVQQQQHQQQQQPAANYGGQGINKPNVGNAGWDDYFSQRSSQQPQGSSSGQQSTYPNQQPGQQGAPFQQTNAQVPYPLQQRSINPQQQPIISQLQQQLQQQQQQQQQQQFSNRGAPNTTYQQNQTPSNFPQSGLPQQQSGYSSYQSNVQVQPQISPTVNSYNSPPSNAYNPSVYDPFSDVPSSKAYNPNANLPVQGQAVYQPQQQSTQYGRPGQSFPTSNQQSQGWQQTGRSSEAQPVPQTNSQLPYNPNVVVPSISSVSIANPANVAILPSLSQYGSTAPSTATSRSARWSSSEASNPIAAASNVAAQHVKPNNYLPNYPTTYPSNTTNTNTVPSINKPAYTPSTHAINTLNKYASNSTTANTGRERTSNTSTTYSTSNASSNYKGKNPRPRSRSRSPVKSKSDSFSGSKRRASSRSPTRDRSSKSTSSDSNINRKIDYAIISPSQLLKDFHTPSIGKFNNTLSIQDLLIRYPDLYIPADFVKLDIDWHSILYSEQAGVFSNLPKSAFFMFESNPLPLSIESTHPGYSSMLEPPKFTYLTPENPLFNKQVISMPGIVSSAVLSSRYLNLAFKSLENNIKPVKFNARVIVSLGFKDYEADRIDHNLTRKLRVLIGRRKGSVMLLGSSWSKELDGGDPLADRSCLLQTARRAVKAQSLLDISDISTCLVTKLCELSYHRPQEEFKGKTYPEQDEITAIYLCTLHDPPKPTGDIYDDLNFENFTNNWKLYLDRCNGKNVAPTLNGNDIDFNLTTKTEDIVVDVVLDSTVDDEYSADVLMSNENNDTLEESNSNEQIDDNNSSSNNIIESKDSDDNDENQESNEDKSNDNNIVSESNNDMKSEEPGEVDEVVKSSNEDETDKTMPKNPCVLLCQQPIPKDITSDVAKKSDAVSLRILPLSSILSYSQDDSNERIFEASLAAEILQSVIALSFANIITDFLLSEHKVLNYIVDPRILLAVRTLHKQKPTSTTPPAIVETNEVVKDETNKVLKVNEGDISDNKPIEKDDGFIPFTTESKDTETIKVTSKIDFLQISSFNSNPVVLLDNAPVMTLNEAKSLHKDFISACRWFDVHQEHFLRLDHLQLILYSSYRDISRADITALAWDICKDEKFKYDSHF